jgi:hypothetical protein
VHSVEVVVKLAVLGMDGGREDLQAGESAAK